MIESAFEGASRETNKKENVQNNENLIPFVTTYNKNNPNIYNEVIAPTIGALRLMDSFKNSRIIKAYKQPKNLYRILNRNNKEIINGITKCGEPRCSCCNCLVVGKSVDFKVENVLRTFNIKSNLNCLSCNVIYALFCKGCHQFYIGQTGGMFRTRITIHRQHILHPHYAILNVSKHIASCASEHEVKFMAAPIYQLPPQCSKYHREKKDEFFISMLKPPLNKNEH